MKPKLVHTDVRSPTLTHHHMDHSKISLLISNLPPPTPSVRNLAPTICHAFM